MTRCWLALVAQRPADAFAAAAARTEAGADRGFLAAWRRSGKPVRPALRVDERIIDPGGAPAWVSLVLAPEGVRLAFDDLAVQQARREVLARTPLDGVSTLLRDDSHFEGSITVARGPDALARLADDPFARVFPALLLSIEAGAVGRVVPPVGPTIERYGSANPWPCDRWAGQSGERRGVRTAAPATRAT